MLKRAIVVLLVSAAVVAAWQFHLLRGPRAAQSDAIPDLLTQVPRESTVVFYVDLSALRSSPFFTQITAMAPAVRPDTDYAEFLRATGFDYARDLDRVVVAGSPATAPRPSALVLAEGRFDQDRITTYLLREGKVEKQNGADLYLFSKDGAPRNGALAFLSSERVAIADSDQLAAFLGARGAAGLGPEVRDRVVRVSGSAIFAVGRVPPLPENFGAGTGGWRSEQLANLARSVRWFSLAGRPDGDRMRVSLEGECDTLENAMQLAGALDGLRLMGQVALSDPKTRQQLGPAAATSLEALMPSIQVQRDDQRVRLLLEITPETLRALSPKTPAAEIPANPNHR